MKFEWISGPMLTEAALVSGVFYLAGKRINVRLHTFYGEA